MSDTYLKNKDMVYPSLTPISESFKKFKWNLYEFKFVTAKFKIMLLNIGDNNYFLIMYYPPSDDVKDWMIPNDEIKLLSKLKKIEDKEKCNLVVMLESGGGFANPAFKMAHILQTNCKKLTFVVPYRAKSAATLMALGGDEIVMGCQSELGPLDAQIEYPEGHMMSALDGVQPINQIHSISRQAMIAFAKSIRKEKELGLSRIDSVQIAAKFAADYVKPLVDKIDPIVTNICFRELMTAERYCIDLLTNYMLKDKPKKAKAVSHEIVWGYPEHGFAIRRDEARKLELNIVDAERFDKWDLLWKIYLSLKKEKKKMISFLTEAELKDIIKKEIK